MSLRSLDQIPAGTQLSTSVAIVGAGPAGITIALGLSARGVDVMLLEGGGTEFDERSQQRYAGDLATTPELTYPPLDAWRLRMLGGTSNHWGGWCRRFETNVFGSRPWLNDTSWPFDRSELDDGYQRAQETCELGRDLYDAVTIQADLGLTAWTDLSRHGLQNSIWRFSPPTLFGHRYRTDLEAAALDLILGANVVSIETDRDAVSSLMLIGDDGGRRYVTADVFVIATGGLESVRQLLLLEESSTVPIDRSGWLGRGFMEHPHGAVGTVVVDSALTNDDGPLAIFRERRQDVDGVDVRGGVTVTPEACAEFGLANMSFTIDGVAAGTPPLASLPRGIAVSELVELLGNGRPSVAHRIYARSEQRPNRASRITLTNATDDLGVKRIKLDWQVEPSDLSDLATGVTMLTKAFASLGISVVHNPGIETPTSGMTGGGHHMGGARMHDDPRHGVVAADLRVHGLANLYVCSASTFPTSDYANPTLTIVALAHRLTETLALR